MKGLIMQELKIKCVKVTWLVDTKYGNAGDTTTFESGAVLFYTNANFIQIYDDDLYTWFNYFECVDFSKLEKIYE